MAKDGLSLSCSNVDSSGPIMTEGTTCYHMRSLSIDCEELNIQLSYDQVLEYSILYNIYMNLRTIEHYINTGLLTYRTNYGMVQSVPIQNSLQEIRRYKHLITQVKYLD
jgi:hypothetical protein